MLRAGVISSLICLAVTPAVALEDFYICTVLTDGECTEFSASLEGIAALEQIGITPDAVAYAFGWGFGAVIVAFGFGVACGLVHFIITSSTRSPHYE